MTTIVPFNDQSKLPACAAACGPLYDANGGCVPPAIPSGPLSNYQACFCINTNVAGFSTASDAVCPDACTGEAGGQASIASWFSSICHITANPGGNDDNNGGAAKTTSSAGSKPTNVGIAPKKEGPWYALPEHTEPTRT